MKLKHVIMITGLILAVFCITNAKADMVTSTLLDHVGPVTQFKNGETSIAVVDSIVMIGSYKGKSILDLQAGFNSDIKPEPGQTAGADLIAGGFFKLSSLVGDKLHVPAHWEFLRSLEYGVSYFYNFREKRDFLALQVGLAFDLNPIQ